MVTITNHYIKYSKYHKIWFLVYVLEKNGIKTVYVNSRFNSYREVKAYFQNQVCFSHLDFEDWKHFWNDSEPFKKELIHNKIVFPW
jgi:hypothetical protein